MTGRALPLMWRLLAVVMLLLALIGVVLPVMPTVPFLVAAAWAAGRGWPALEARLLAHPVFGESIRQWREHGAVSRKAKWTASVMMLVSACTIALAPTPTWLKVVLPMMLGGVGWWLWRRPET